MIQNILLSTIGFSTLWLVAVYFSKTRRQGSIASLIDSKITLLLFLSLYIVCVTNDDGSYFLWLCLSFFAVIGSLFIGVKLKNREIFANGIPIFALILVNLLCRIIDPYNIALVVFGLVFIFLPTVIFASRITGVFFASIPIVKQSLPIRILRATLTITIIFIGIFAWLSWSGDTVEVDSRASLFKPPSSWTLTESRSKPPATFCIMGDCQSASRSWSLQQLITSVDEMQSVAIIDSHPMKIASECFEVWSVFTEKMEPTTSCTATLHLNGYYYELWHHSQFDNEKARPFVVSLSVQREH